MKLRKKLIMSAVALAACAATLTSTTYAWYVSNQEATVTGMTGKTQATTGSSVYVSSDGINFKGDITLIEDQYTVQVPTGLQPITYQTVDDTTGFYTLDGDELDDSNAAYYKFSVWVKSDKAVTVVPHFTVTNATTTLPTQTAYQNISEDVLSSETFSVDAVQALYAKIDTVAGEASEEAGNVGGYLYTGTADEKVYAVQTLSKTATTVEENITWNNYTVKDGSLTDSEITNAQSDEDIRNAHEYYTDIVGQAPTYTSVYSTLASEWANITLAADVPTKLTFTIWLDGADTLCFDACAGQNFTFALNFTAQ